LFRIWTLAIFDSLSNWHPDWDFFADWDNPNPCPHPRPNQVRRLLFVVPFLVVSDILFNLNDFDVASAWMDADTHVSESNATCVATCQVQEKIKLEFVSFLQKKRDISLREVVFVRFAGA